MIEIDRVGKTFHGAGGPVAALSELSLRVADGEFLALIGPSGCGKSTLLRLVGDLEQPDVGGLRVRGKAPRQARLDHDYGIVFQSPVLYEWRSVRENVALPLEIVGRPARERRARADELLRLVGLADFADAYPRQLSGGMQQRAAIARALSFAPAILLMDEPFGALDELTRERMQLELLAIWAGAPSRPTVIFVTHSIPEAVFLADRVAVMSPRPGRVERVVPISLPRPRAAETRADPRFFALITEVRAALRDA
ncbi:ABC transporter ATP-binding protein [Chloroflexales bacterium ZM16-3]|nr:ABC transporter ATP-binding protein [Chloroflexales bacterium ZM16-3]